MTAPWTLLLTLALAAAGQSTTLSSESLAHYRAAVAQVQAGQFSEAVPTLQSLAKQYPQVAEILATRCSAHIGLKQFDQAQKDCQAGLKLKPSLSIALYSLALAEEKSGKVDEALGHYREYAAGTDAPFAAQAQARIKELSQPAPPLEVAAPPGVAKAPAGAPASAPAAATAPPAPSPAPAVGTGRIIFYRNHFLPRYSDPVTLLVDDKVVGDIGHDQYVEITVGTGEHVVEACLGGIRHANNRGFVFDMARNRDGSFAGFTLGGAGLGDRLRGLTVPVEVQANGVTYVNLDTVGGQLMLVNQPQRQGEKEVRQDCKRAYGRTIR